jgi:hypothetical protein
MTVCSIRIDSLPRRSNYQGARAQHSARCGGYKALPCGTIPAARFKDLVATAHALVQRARQQRKEKNVHGFQRTPGFIHAAICKAGDITRKKIGSAESDAEVTQESSPPTARGGFTDVGKHTGGDTVRETCWPLVKALIQVGAWPPDPSRAGEVDGTAAGHDLGSCT